MRGGRVKDVVEVLIAAAHDEVPDEPPPHRDHRYADHFMNLLRETNQRRETIASYANLARYPALFNVSAGWLPEWLEPSMMEAVQNGTPAAIRSIMKVEAPGVYSFPMFTPLFRSMLLEELDNYKQSGLPIRQPNSMNRYGIIVNEIGMRPMISELQRLYLAPIAKELYPVEGAELNGHHSFMVQYKSGEDLGLDMHTDDSDVTFNFCLGKEFTGAGLTFCGRRGTPEHRKFLHGYQHVLGRGLVHLGEHRHGADNIITGERNNLIVWNHNFSYRKANSKDLRHRKEIGKPDEQCLSYTHDRDYTHFKAIPRGAEETVLQRPGWCPPEEACYDSMAPANELRIERREAAIRQQREEL